MGAASNASSDGGRWSETPLARGLLFLSIDWSIAGAFLVLQNLLPELVEQTVTRGWVSPDIAVNRNLDEEAQRRCAEPQTAARPAPSLATLQRARYTAYQMGFGFGTAAVAHTSGTNQRELIVRALQEVQREAMVLGVPPPELPVIRHMAAALGEFADDLETDRQCTAARLASHYTPAHANIYKLGVVVGFSVPYCVNGRCTAYAVQIRRYAQAAELPEHLWLPLALGSLDGVPGANATEKTARIIVGLDSHIRTGR
jgi:hypothetical protein